MAENSKQLWTPADIYGPFHDVGASLPHMHTRIKKGLITPSIKGKGQGSKQRYDAFNALLYAIATNLEKNGYDLDIAYDVALDTLGEWFFGCLREDVWIVEYNNNSRSTNFVPNAYKVSEMDAEQQKSIQKLKQIFPDVDIDDEHYIEVLPFLGVSLHIHKAICQELKDRFGEIRSIRYINISKIVKDCIVKLGVNDFEVEMLAKASIKRRIKGMK